MIIEFLFPILGWLFVFVIAFVVYSKVFDQKFSEGENVPGQTLFVTLTCFFWIVVYMCLSSIWSILYSLIDLKYPDVVGAVSNYGTSGFSESGVVFDAFAFPLSMILVSSVTACVLAFYLVRKVSQDRRLRPTGLYNFLYHITMIGGAILAFSGFVYVTYSWLYGNLPIAVLLKGLVAFFIVGSVALYFHLVKNRQNQNESLISQGYALLLVVITILTLFASFKVIGTPAEARKYRLDNLIVNAARELKYEVDSQSENLDKRVDSLEDVKANIYVYDMSQKNKLEFISQGDSYKICALFNSATPKTINMVNHDKTWDHEMGYSCFSFKYPEPRQNDLSGTKGDYIPRVGI